MTQEQLTFWGAVVQIIPVLALGLVIETRTKIRKRIKFWMGHPTGDFPFELLVPVFFMVLAVGACGVELLGLMYLNLSQVSRIISAVLRFLTGGSRRPDPTYASPQVVAGTLTAFNDIGATVAIVVVGFVLLSVFLSPIFRSMSSLYGVRLRALAALEAEEESTPARAESPPSDD